MVKTTTDRVIMGLAPIGALADTLGRLTRLTRPRSQGRLMNDPLLLALGELVRKEISAGELLQRVVGVMAQQLDADRGTIFLLNEARTELVSIAGHLPEIKEIRVPIEHGVAGYVARTERVVNIPFCEDDKRFWRRIDDATGYNTRSMLAGPLYDADGQLTGIVQFLNKGTGIFNDEDERQFRGLSAQVAALLSQTTLGQGHDYTGQADRRTSLPSDELNGESPLLDRFNRIIGQGAAMQQVFRQIRRVAPTDATVLLRGESGTGKSLIARALHHNSPRSAGPFIQVDCTTLPEGLMENELFGHERGAFTGAQQRQRGKVEQADGGTLFLDEIGDLPLSLQGKLLRVIQERSFTRLGGTETLSANIRIVAATNRDLEGLVGEGRFREDLYYRLRVVIVEMPPLRLRGREDLLRLINHFVAKAARRHNRPVQSIRRDALGVLLSHSWPGNVRELENCVESAVIFSDGEITPSRLSLPRRNATMELPAFHPDHVEAINAIAQRRRASEQDDRFAAEPSLRELEASYIAYLLDAHEGNRSACARILGVGRNTLLRKIKEYDLG